MSETYWKNIANNPRACQTFTAIFLDVMQTACDEGRLPCPEATRTLVLLLFKDKYQAKAMRLNHPELLRICSRFMCTPRTKEELAALARTQPAGYNRCPCSRQDAFVKNRLMAWIHRHEYDEISSPLVIILESLANLLGNVIENLHLETTHKKCFNIVCNAAMYGRKRPWPAGRLDVLPFGAQVSIQSLCCWTPLFPARLLPRLLRMVYWQYMSGTDGTIPSLLGQMIIPRILMPAVSSVLRRATSHESLSRDYLDTVNSLYDSAQILKLLESWDNDELLTAIGPLRTDYETLTKLCTSTKKVVDVAISTCGVSATIHDDIQIYFERAAGRLRAVLGISEGYVLPHPYPGTISTPLFGYLHYLTRNIRCARAGCLETPLSLGRRLRVCGGCGHVFYCSRACQKLAWKDPLAQHRTMCNAIKTIMEQLYTAQPDDAVSQGYDPSNRTHFHNLCVRAGVDASDAKRVADYLRTVYGR